MAVLAIRLFDEIDELEEQDARCCGLDSHIHLWSRYQPVLVNNIAIFVNTYLHNRVPDIAVDEKPLRLGRNHKWIDRILRTEFEECSRNPAGYQSIEFSQFVTRQSF